MSLKTSAFAAILLVFFLSVSLAFAYPGDISTLQDVETGGLVVHANDTVTRSQLVTDDASWAFHFTWPNPVSGLNAFLVLFRGSFGHVEGGSLQQGINYAVTQAQWAQGETTLSKTFSLAALGDRSTLSGTYTALIADASGADSLVNWFASGGPVVDAPHSFSTLTFNYVATDDPHELPGALTSVAYRGVSIKAGSDLYRDDLPSLDTSSSVLDTYWDLSFDWPVAVPNTRGVIMLFRGTFGNVVGGDAVLGQNYAVTNQQWAEGQNDFGKYLDFPAFKAPTSVPGDYTVVLAETDPKYPSSNHADEARWFASGGSDGTPPVRYAFLTFHFKGDLPSKPVGITAPVIIIPGIVGSQKQYGKWVIDPLFHAYDNLIDTLVANGYQNGVTLFTFPYDWRASNVDSAVLLKQKIAEVKSICGCDQVDIVAHSMGGLLTRQYIESADYAHDVRRLVFLGTPQMGAPADYLMWEGGEEEGGDYFSALSKLLFLGEALEHGYLTLRDYVQKKPIESVRELLPTYDYLTNADGTPHAGYPETYPRNAFLEALNQGARSLADSGVEITNIIGNLEKDTTVSAIRVTHPAQSGTWDDGYPEHFSDAHSDRGLEYGSGDGAVPLSSANFINSDVEIVNSDHTSLPTVAASSVYHALTLEPPASVIQKPLAERFLIIRDYSPVDLLVTAPDGSEIGEDFSSDSEVNEIPGSFYTGADAEDEFIAIPDPIEGTYTVATRGTGDGAYTLEASYVDQATSTSEYVAGETTKGEETAHVFVLDPTHADTPVSFAPAAVSDAPSSGTASDTGKAIEGTAQADAASSAPQNPPSGAIYTDISPSVRTTIGGGPLYVDPPSVVATSTTPHFGASNSSSATSLRSKDMVSASVPARKVIMFQHTNITASTSPTRSMTLKYAASALGAFKDPERSPGWQALIKALISHVSAFIRILKHR